MPNDDCPNCDGLKVSQINGQTRVEVPETFGLPQGETYESQIAQAMAAAEALAMGEAPTGPAIPTEPPSHAPAQPTRPSEMPPQMTTPPPTQTGQMFTSAELFGNTLPEAHGRNTSNNFTLAETDAADVLGQGTLFQGEKEKRVGRDRPISEDDAEVLDDATELGKVESADEAKKLPTECDILYHLQVVVEKELDRKEVVRNKVNFVAGDLPWTDEETEKATKAVEKAKANAATQQGIKNEVEQIRKLFALAYIGDTVEKNISNAADKDADAIAHAVKCPELPMAALQCDYKIVKRLGRKSELVLKDNYVIEQSGKVNGDYTYDVVHYVTVSLRWVYDYTIECVTIY